jgi:RNA-binding protein
MPSTPLRRQLRAHGHSLRPIVMIGKHGVTSSLRRELQLAAFAHELVKIRIASECPLDRFEVAQRLGAEPGIRIVQILGRVLLVYKRHPQEPRFEGKGKGEGEGEGEDKTKARAKPGRAPRSTGGAGARSSARPTATTDRPAPHTRRAPRRSTPPHHPTAPPVADGGAGARTGSRPSARSRITKGRSPGRR